MDDHMLDRIKSEIALCFELAEIELQDGQDIRENYQYKSAAVLIKAYNQLAKLYYNIDYNKMGSVEKEYRMYLENKDLF